jgi:hypothetical protein
MTNIITAVGIRNKRKNIHLTTKPTTLPSKDVSLSASFDPSKITFNGVAAKPNVHTIMSEPCALFVILQVSS